MRMLITLILLAALGVVGMKKVVVEKKKLPNTIWQKNGSCYAEYSVCNTGPAFCSKKTGRCSLYASGAYPYNCN